MISIDMATDIGWWMIGAKMGLVKGNFTGDRTSHHRDIVGISWGSTNNMECVSLVPKWGIPPLCSHEALGKWGLEDWDFGAAYFPTNQYPTNISLWINILWYIVINYPEPISWCSLWPPKGQAWVNRVLFMTESSTLKPLIPWHLLVWNPSQFPLSWLSHFST